MEPTAPEMPMPEISPIVIVVYAVMAILMIVSMWKIFVKAGRPGWGSIVPIYNIVLMWNIGGKSGWMTLLFFVPIANFVAAFLLNIGIAKAFGKSAGYGVGMVFLPFIFMPMLAFGDARYQGVQAAGAVPAGSTPQFR